MKRRWIIPGCLFLIAILGGLGYWRLTLPPAPQRQNVNNASAVAPVPRAGSEEDKKRRSVLGVWQDQYQGKRTMTLNEDGTGTMLVELSGVQAALFASKLRFDMQWSLDGKKLIKKTVGGEPASKVNLILNTMGDTAEDIILEVTEERLLLLDKDGKTQYDWRRVKNDEKGKQ